MGFLDSLRNKVELYRLEQRYTKRDKRTTFVSTAEYRDGEYVHIDSPTSAKLSSTFGSGFSGKRKGPPSWVKERRGPPPWVQQRIDRRQSRAL
ncbi:hypothetical protein LTR37_011168 [Vermiconidia calcicola]|uniref:Uncharacterized protein n=1 Tax=Vermiconidia calcicola TaxID=1690605 RepID=A0ACC3N3I9_9PEZI|nr:hypothetical protein LTR37_011168 [Vermiconidia calcicola]